MPDAVLLKWSKPATTPESAAAALRVALEMSVIGDVEYMCTMIHAALGFLEGRGRWVCMAEAATLFMSEIFGSAATARRLNEYLGHGAENKDVMVALPDHPTPDVLALARPPEFWAERFVAVGIRMAARTLREKAAKAGLRYYVEKNVLITPAQIDALMIWRGKQEAKSPSPKSASASREYQEVRRKLLAKRKT